MSDWHRGALVSLDFESSGLDVENDRIVTACIALVDGTGQTKPEFVEAVIDPGIPIPAKAAAIHGMTIDKIRAHPLCVGARDGIEFIADMLVKALVHACPGAPLVGHNIGGYDLTLLDRELRRHDLGTLPDLFKGHGVFVVDTCTISRHLHPRRPRPNPEQGAHALKTCAQAHGVPWSDADAHGSTYDALTAARIAWAMADTNPAIARMPLRELHAAQGRWHRDWAAGLAAHLRSKGRPVEGLEGHWPLRPFEGQQEIRAVAS